MRVPGLPSAEGRGGRGTDTANHRVLNSPARVAFRNGFAGGRRTRPRWRSEGTHRTRGHWQQSHMAKNRYVNTDFWVDSYIARLGTNEKLAFLYLLTSPLANIAGTYEMPVKRALFDSGIPAKEFAAALDRFESDGKIVRQDDWIGIVNFIKHQSLNPKVRQGIIAELERVPRTLMEKLPVSVSALRMGFDRLSHPNSNLNFNSNLNSNAALSSKESTTYPQDMREGIDSLARKLRIRR